MGINQKTQLSGRLRGYFDGIGAGTRRHAGNWQVYAAVTGSAMAMATNASAQILHTGVGDVITAQLSSVSISNLHPESTKSVFLTNGQGANLKFRTTSGATELLGFDIGVEQGLGDGPFGRAFVEGFKGGQFGFLQTATFLKKFSSGATAAPLTGTFRGGFRTVATQFIGQSNHQSGWAPSQAGLFGFSFTSTGSQNPQRGFVKLEYFEGANHLANQIEVIGSDVSATPEPATGGLALLAAGAMGVIALRRRRKNAA